MNDAEPTLPLRLKADLPLTAADWPRPAAHRLAEGDLAKAARDFESVLLYRVFEEMRRTVPDSGLLESGMTDQVQGMFWFYLAQDVSAKGGLGLWKELARQMQGRGAAERPTQLESDA